MSKCDHIVGTCNDNFALQSELPHLRELYGWSELDCEYNFCPKCGTPLRGEWSGNAPSEVGEYWLRRKGEKARKLIEIKPKYIGAIPTLDEWEWYSLPVRGPDL